MSPPLGTGINFPLRRFFPSSLLRNSSCDIHSWPEESDVLVLPQHVEQLWVTLAKTILHGSGVWA